MQAVTVQTLVQKAQFPPETALAIGEAMDQAIVNAQLVTLPSLDARLADLRADLRVEMREMKAELTRWMFLAVTAQTGVLTGIIYFMLHR